MADKILSANKDISADDHVLRGYLMLGFPLSHLARDVPQINKVGLPSNSTDRQRYIIAATEFLLALRRQKELKAFSVAQVHGYVARSYCKLAKTILVDSSGSSEREVDKIEARLCFNTCFDYYQKSLSLENTNSKYSLATNFIEELIASRDFDYALQIIREIRLLRLRRAFHDGDELLRLQAETYYIMGRYSQAGLSYEAWLKSGTGFFHISKDLIERLRDLKSKTGHPQNIPLK